MPGVGDLVVVLQEIDEVGRRQVERRGAAPLLLPGKNLSLVEVAPFEGRDEFLRIAVIVGVVGFIAADERHHGGMMEVVVPNCIQAVAALLRRAYEASSLPLVLGDDDDRTISRG